MSKTSINYEKKVVENKKRKLHFKKGDTVFVISGDDKGKTGEVLHVVKKHCVAIVKGVNMCKKVVPTEEGTKTIMDVENKIHVSNLKKFEKKK